MRQLLKFEIFVHDGWQPGDPMCIELYTKWGTAMKERILHFGIAQPLAEDDVEFVGSRIQEVIEGTMVRTLGIQRQLL